MKNRILIVEDEPDMARVLQYNFKQAGYQTAVAHDGTSALEMLRDPMPDLVILDWMLPDQPGTEVCRHMRRTEGMSDTPVIMVSAKGEEIDRVVGFEIGVDDYVSKPFNVRELLLRVRAILGRRAPESPRSGFAEVGELRLDLDAYRVYVGEQEIPITNRESRLLSVLAASKGRVVERSDLLRDVWGPDSGVTTAAVDSHIKRLRIKLGDAGRYLQTVRGVGYTLSADTRSGHAR